MAAAARTGTGAVTKAMTRERERERPKYSGKCKLREGEMSKVRTRAAVWAGALVGAGVVTRAMKMENQGNGKLII